MPHNEQTPEQKMIQNGGSIIERVYLKGELEKEVREKLAELKFMNHTDKVNLFVKSLRKAKKGNWDESKIMKIVAYRGNFGPEVIEASKILDTEKIRKIREVKKVYEMGVTNNQLVSLLQINNKRL